MKELLNMNVFKKYKYCPFLWFTLIVLIISNITMKHIDFFDYYLVLSLLVVEHLENIWIMKKFD